MGDLTRTNSSSNSGLVYLSVDGKTCLCFLDWQCAAAVNFASDPEKEMSSVDFVQPVFVDFVE